MERRSIPGPGKVFSEVKRAGKSGPARGGGCGARPPGLDLATKDRGASRPRSSPPRDPPPAPGPPRGPACGSHRGVRQDPLTFAGFCSRSRLEWPCPTVPGSQAQPPRECASPSPSRPWICPVPIVGYPWKCLVSTSGTLGHVPRPWEPRNTPLCLPSGTPKHAMSTLGPLDMPCPILRSPCSCPVLSLPLATVSPLLGLLTMSVTLPCRTARAPLGFLTFSSCSQAPGPPHLTPRPRPTVLCVTLGASNPGSPPRLPGLMSAPTDLCDLQLQKGMGRCGAVILALNDNPGFPCPQDLREARLQASTDPL